MFKLNDKIRSFVKERKRRRTQTLLIGALCTITAIGIVGSMIEPAISETEAEQLDKPTSQQIRLEDLNGEQDFTAGDKLKIYSVTDNDGVEGMVLETDVEVTDDEQYISLEKGDYKLDWENHGEIPFTVGEDGLAKASETSTVQSKAEETSQTSAESKRSKAAKPKVKAMAGPPMRAAKTVSGYDDILSQYEIFTLEDLIGEGHFTGAAATGGVMDYAAHGGAGGGRVVADYAETLVRSVVEDDTGLNPNLYYKNLGTTTDEDGNTVAVIPPAKSMQSDDYLDMAGTFANLKTQSDSLGKATGKTYEKSGDKITLKLSGDASKNHFVIPYSEWKELKTIDIVPDYMDNGSNWNNNNKNDKDHTITDQSVIRCGLTVTVTGVGDNAISFNGDGTTGVNITYNGSAFRDYVNGQQQYNFGGTNILWNFPDATGYDADTPQITATAMAGHILAPQTHVNYAGGEGGVIARKVKVGNEIHFFPYGKGVTRPDTSKGSIKVEKKWVDSEGNAVTTDLPDKVEFELYRVPNYDVKINTIPVYDSTNSSSYLYYLDNVKSGSNVKVTFDFGSEYANMNFPNNYGGKTDSNGKITLTSDKFTTVNGKKCIKVTHVGNLSGAETAQQRLEILNKAKITIEDGNETEKNPYQDTYKVTNDMNNTEIPTAISSPSWSTEIGNLPTKDANGYTYKYFVKEKSVTGWTSKVDPNGTELVSDGKTDTAFTVTNKKGSTEPTTPKGKLFIEKKWYKADGETELTEAEIQELSAITIPVEVQRAVGSGDYAKVEDVTLTFDSGTKSWIIEKEYPLKDGDGNSYTYRIEEGTVENYELIGYEVQTGKADSNTWMTVEPIVQEYQLSSTTDTKFIIKNKPKSTEVEMPATGGTGRLYYFLAGFGITGLGVVYLIDKRRKRCI